MAGQGGRVIWLGPGWPPNPADRGHPLAVENGSNILLKMEKNHARDPKASPAYIEREIERCERRVRRIRENPDPSKPKSNILLLDGIVYFPMGLPHGQ